jgi:hypothetical protein
MERGKILLVAVASLVILFFAFYFILNLINSQRYLSSLTILENACGDGTSNGFCSDTKPYFCENGVLVERASVCGCSEISYTEGDSCAFLYKNYSREVSLKYVLNGEEKNLNFIVYGEMSDYLSRVSRVIDSEIGKEPTRLDFKLKELNEENSRELLLPLVVQIQNLANNSVDQARIAVSLVQNIPYGPAETKISFGGGQVGYSLYPYEVVYYQKGICGEKSALLAFLLRELGYDTSILYFSSENHEVVGIKCPIDKSFEETGYCFVETSGPAIITDSSLSYIGGVQLQSKPTIMQISEGISLPKYLPEYKDAKTLRNIRNGNLFGFFESWKFDDIKEKYGLDGEYKLL